MWLNHFQNGFHYDDFHTIVNNNAVHGFGSMGRFFRDPKAFSSLREYASWRPLLSATFALDYAEAREGSAQLFLIDTFVWFLALLGFIYVLFRVIPGGNTWSALFGTALVGMHPATADAISYISQRGTVLAALGIVMGLGGWIVWPRLLPKRIDLKAPHVPKTDWQFFLIQTQVKVDKAWTALIRAPLALYLIPVVLALLASPEAAAFAPILLAYVILLDADRKPRHVIPAGIVCSVLWLVPLVATWKYGAAVRQPLLAYWASQPLAALRYLATFADPGLLAIDSGTEPAGVLGALAGIAGLGALIALAIVLSRRREWRAVAFGLWWFLLALLPDALVPQRDIDGSTRMFAAMIGLVLALTRAGSIAYERSRASEDLKLPAAIGLAAAGVLVLGGFGWATAQRDWVWNSEDSAWLDAMDKNPRNGRAAMHYAQALMDEGGDAALSYDMMKRAAAMSPQDVSIEQALARTAIRLGRWKEAEEHYKRVIAIKPDWAAGYGVYARWLLEQLRAPEAAEIAKKGVALQVDEPASRAVLTDIGLQRHDWDKAMQFAGETLRMNPEDADAARAISVATLALDEIKKDENNAASLGTDGYLRLSVTYFKNSRYEDCIRAAKEALKIDPNLAPAWSNISAAYHAMGKLEESIDAAKEAVRLNPNLPRAKSHLDQVLAEKASLQQKDRDGNNQ